MGVFSSLSAKDAPDRVERNFWSWYKRKKGKEKKWMNTQSGRSTKPISPGGGRKGTKRSRRFGPSIITPSPRKTAHSYASGAKYLFGAKTYVKPQSAGEGTRGHQAYSWEGEGGEGQTLPRRQQGTCTPSQILPPTVIPVKLGINLQVRKQFTSALG